MNKFIAKLTEDEIRSLGIIWEKKSCARQVLCPGAVPYYAPESVADKFFREAIFALADIYYLEKHTWHSIAQKYNVAEKNIGKLYADFVSGELAIKGNI
jgi:hypothetical protein